MSASVHVTNLSSSSSEKEIKDFFSFCGKINSIELSKGENETQKAKVTFEKETAAKTALLLDNTQLSGSTVSVTSADSGTSTTEKSSGDDETISQEDKPRSRIFAEYLAHGYVLSDQAIERAIALDKQHGVSDKFTKTLHTYDEKYHVTDRAKAVDNSYGITEKGTSIGSSIYNTLSSYFVKALETPTGQKLADFYQQGNKQVVDIHNEARRLADLKSGKSQSDTAHSVDAAIGTEPVSEKTAV